MSHMGRFMEYLKIYRPCIVRTSFSMGPVQSADQNVHLPLVSQPSIRMTSLYLLRRQLNYKSASRHHNCFTMMRVSHMPSCLCSKIKNDRLRRRALYSGLRWLAPSYERIHCQGLQTAGGSWRPNDEWSTQLSYGRFIKVCELLLTLIFSLCRKAS